MFSEATISIVKDWVEEVWNKGNLDALGRFHPPTFENHGQPATIEETKKWHENNRRTFPDIQYTIDDMVASGDSVTFRWSASATHQGALWNFIPPTGKVIHWSGMHMLRLMNDQIVEVWAVQDTLGQLRQMGVTLEPPQG